MNDRNGGLMMMLLLLKWCGGPGNRRVGGTVADPNLVLRWYSSTSAWWPGISRLSTDLQYDVRSTQSSIIR